MVEPVGDIQGRLNYSMSELDESRESPIGSDRLLRSDSPATRFGSFDATLLSGYVEVLEQGLRLCRLLAGDLAGWLDTGTRSLAAVVDAWGKAVTTLGVPQRANRARLPGGADTDVQRWAGIPATPDGHGLLADVLARATG